MLRVRRGLKKREGRKGNKVKRRMKWITLCVFKLDNENEIKKRKLKKKEKGR